MLDDYLIVHKSILPDYFEKVLEVRYLLESGKVSEVSQAVQMVGISRSTYYKYKDYILEPAEIQSSHKAVLSMMLTHEAGILSSLLARISETGASVLTITQSLPIHGMASVTISLDTGNMSVSVNELQSKISAVQGVENARLLAMD